MTLPTEAGYREPQREPGTGQEQPLTFSPTCGRSATRARA